MMRRSNKSHREIGVFILMDSQGKLSLSMEFFSEPWVNEIPGMAGSPPGTAVGEFHAHPDLNLDGSLAGGRISDIDIWRSQNYGIQSLVYDSNNFYHRTYDQPNPYNTSPR